MKCLLAIVAAAIALGQAGPKFDAASVRKGALPVNGVAGMTSGWPGSDNPGRFRGRLVTLEQLVELAYGVRLFQVEGPSWIYGADLEDRFDVSAVYDPKTTQEQFQLMVQDLLAERFHLRLHRVNKVLPAYELVLASGGSKLKESLASRTLMTTPTKGGVRLSSTGVKVSDIIPFLQPHLDQYQLVDKTGLTGKYDISLEFIPMSAVQ